MAKQIHRKLSTASIGARPGGRCEEPVPSVRHMKSPFPNPRSPSTLTYFAEIKTRYRQDCLDGFPTSMRDGHLKQGTAILANGTGMFERRNSLAPGVFSFGPALIPLPVDSTGPGLERDISPLHPVGFFATCDDMLMPLVSRHESGSIARGSVERTRRYRCCSAGARESSSLPVGSSLVFLCQGVTARRQPSWRCCAETGR